jgi:hypothetical protein
MLGAARMPSAARSAGALTRGGRDAPRPRAPLPIHASAPRLGGLTGCSQTPSGGGVAQRRLRLPSPCMMVAMIRSAPRWQNGPVAISRAHPRLSNCTPLQGAAVLASCASTLCWVQRRAHRRAQCAMGSYHLPLAPCVDSMALRVTPGPKAPGFPGIHDTWLHDLLCFRKALDTSSALQDDPADASAATSPQRAAAGHAPR